MVMKLLLMVRFGLIKQHLGMFCFSLGECLVRASLSVR